MHDVQISNGAVATDRGHAALVPIIETLWLRPLEHVQNVAARRGGPAGSPPAKRPGTACRLGGSEIRQVPDHLHLTDDPESSGRPAR